MKRRKNDFPGQCYAEIGPSTILKVSYTAMNVVWRNLATMARYGYFTYLQKNCVKNIFGLLPNLIVFPS